MEENELAVWAREGRLDALHTYSFEDPVAVSAHAILANERTRLRDSVEVVAKLE